MRQHVIKKIGTRGRFNLYQCKDCRANCIAVDLAEAEKYFHTIVEPN